MEQRHHEPADAETADDPQAERREPVGELVRSSGTKRVPFWKRGWALSLACVGAIAAFAAAWQFLAPADWVRPAQYLVGKPAPQIGNVETVRRWPALGPDGATLDTAMLRLSGEPLVRSLSERNWVVAFCWRLDEPSASRWRLAWRTGQRAAPVAVPASAANQGAWNINVSASCPSHFRGFVEVMPVMVSPETYKRLSDIKSPQQGAKVAMLEGVRGNPALAETTGTTVGENPSPYRQVESLNPNVPIARYRDILGRETSWSYIRGGREYYFITHDYCVEAITDRHGLVVMYAVTTLSTDFRPTFGYYDVQGRQQATLGKTRFAECNTWGPPPSEVWSYAYAGSYSYCEAFCMPSAANYLTVFLGNSYLGKPQMTSFEGMSGIYGHATRQQVNQMAESRVVNVINTYGVCGRGPKSAFPAQFLSTKGWLGPMHWDLGSVTLSDENPAGAAAAATGADTTPKANIVVEKSGFSVSRKGREVGYGLVLRNTSNFDAIGADIDVALLDESGVTIGLDEFWLEVIPAGQTFFMGRCIDVEKRKAPSALKVLVRAERGQLPKLRLPQATDIRFSDESLWGTVGTVVRGRITNDSDRTLKGMAYIGFVLFDKDGNVVGGGEGWPDWPIRPGRTVSFQSFEGTTYTPASKVATVGVSVDADFKEK